MQSLLKIVTDIIIIIIFLFSTEEEYKRLSEALADEGTYNAVAFKYSADYYDPSQPTEEEDANKETGENSRLWTFRAPVMSISYLKWKGVKCVAA